MHFFQKVVSDRPLVRPQVHGYFRTTDMALFRVKIIKRHFS